MSILDHVRIAPSLEEQFELHSGGRSPVLFNVNGMLANAQDRDYVFHTLKENLLVRNAYLAADYTIVGIELGGALCALLMADRLKQECIILRKDNTFSAPVSHKQTIIVDDVITTGSSIEHARERVTLEFPYTTVIGTTCVVNRRPSGVLS